MKKLNIYIFALLGIIGCALAACDDDDNVTVAKAVLASAPSLTFEGVSAQPQSILIYADADWYSEAPEYITITPATGHGGTTEVSVSIADNMRDGALDNPRQVDILFRGTTKKSIATVTVFQSGDTYRGVADYAIYEIATAPDKTAMVVPGVTVAENFVKGQVVTDGTDFAYVTGFPEGMTLGAVGTLQGVKASDDAGYPYVQGEVFKATSTAEFTRGEAADITDNLDSYSPDAMKYVSVTGHIDGNNLLVDGQACSVVAVDAVEGLSFGDLSNHKVKVEGYFAGKSGKTIRLLATTIEDLGMYQIVYWSEDFEWLEPWSSQKPAGQTVETNNPDATAQQLATNKVTIDGKSVSTYDALLAKGYEFPSTYLAEKSRNPYEQIYLQRNYIKFGLTGYYSGITLPSIDGVPAGAKPVMSFVWSSQRQGSGTWDPTELVVVVKNGDSETKFEVPKYEYEKNEAYKWIPVSIDLNGVTITKDTKITIRNSDAQWPEAKIVDKADKGPALRWFIDNIKIVEAEE